MGIENMLASMLGITPDDMKRTATQLQTGFETFANTLVRIEQKLDILLAEKERQDNDGSNNSNCDGSIGLIGSDGNRTGTDG